MTVLRETLIKDMTGFQGDFRKLNPRHQNRCYFVWILCWLNAVTYNDNSAKPLLQSQLWTLLACQKQLVVAVQLSQLLPGSLQWNSASVQFTKVLLTTTEVLSKSFESTSELINYCAHTVCIKSSYGFSGWAPTPVGELIYHTDLQRQLLIALNDKRRRNWIRCFWFCWTKQDTPM